jgi:hypothetical protein
MCAGCALFTCAICYGLLQFADVFLDPLHGKTVALLNKF